MFTIDLLNGQGIPVRTKPQGVAIFVATFAVPVLVAIILAGFFFHNRVVVSVTKQNITSVDTQIAKLADAVNAKQAVEKEKSSVNAGLADVANLLTGHFQWTPILVELVNNIPDSVILTNIEVKKTFIKRKVAKTEKDKKGEANVAVRSLKMRVAANPDAVNDLEVRNFRDKLRNSNVLGPKLDDIIIASQVRDVLEGRDVVCYDIDCVFKPGL